MINLRSINKTYNNNVILKNVDLDIGRGEFIFIKGRSGSGKTTLLNILGLLDNPSSGRVYVESEDISKLNNTEISNIRNSKFGYIFQNYNLIQHYTALENVLTPALLHNSWSKAEKIAKQYLKIVGLAHKYNSYPKDCSGGEQQRIAIARSLINNPEIIIADEPTGNLDAENERGVIQILHNLHRNGKTIICVSHNDIYMNVATKVYIVEDKTLKLYVNKSI
jgi:putative ABC transport system ATP-binding protein